MLTLHEHAIYFTLFLQFVNTFTPKKWIILNFFVITLTLLDNIDNYFIVVNDILRKMILQIKKALVEIQIPY